MTEDPRIESLARYMCLAQGSNPDMRFTNGWKVGITADYVWQTNIPRARELLTLLDWAKENGELGHQHSKAHQLDENGGLVSITSEIRWNTGDSDG